VAVEVSEPDHRVGGVGSTRGRLEERKAVSAAVVSL